MSWMGEHTHPFSTQSGRQSRLTQSFSFAFVAGSYHQDLITTLLRCTSWLVR